MRRLAGVRNREMRGVAAALALVAAAALAAAIARERVEREGTVTDRPAQAARDGYESSSACRACHPSEYASWHASFHRTMTQIASPETVAASFDNVSVSDVVGEFMRLEIRGQQLWAEFYDPDRVGTGVGVGVSAGAGVGPRVAPIQRQVVMTTGSHNQQIYWYATGNTRLLGQLPAIWLTRERTWIPRRAAIMAPPSEAHYSENGAWRGVCVDCQGMYGQQQLCAEF